MLSAVRQSTAIRATAARKFTLALVLGAVFDGVAHAHGLLTLPEGYQTNVLARLIGGVWQQATPPMPVSVSAIAGWRGKAYVAGIDKRTLGQSVVFEWDGAA